MKINYPADRKRPGNVKPHGTRAAARRHSYWGEPWCQECTEGERVRMKSYRDALVAETAAKLGRPASVREAVRFRRQTRAAEVIHG